MRVGEWDGKSRLEKLLGSYDSETLRSDRPFIAILTSESSSYPELQCFQLPAGLLAMKWRLTMVRT